MNTAVGGVIAQLPSVASVCTWRDWGGVICTRWGEREREWRKETESESACDRKKA